ncbi:uncharacterized protein LOC114359767 isoform X3 [Ostrinia furnacalis]|uniref:uncharacterized protein LOC114359767 isoform X3 n=1 Tax=Ostrinia furnacalis TaxID=93504 RepID=UPI00103D5DC8|nr:uncharacterized protein LOC114359767 isoform X3 [Ostrinia furnacalis]
MVWDYCSVNLNSDSTGSFYAGDIVTGSVYLKFKQRKNIERIEFIVVGTSKAQWTRPRPTMPHIKIYSEKKKLLHITEDLFENIQGKTVEPGVLTYPFHFALPNDLPSTFESGFAKVHYCIKIKSKGVCKRKKVTPFVVFGNINLNHIEEYLKLRYSIREGYADEEKKISKVEHDKFQNTKEESFALSIEIPHICPTSLHIPEPMINISYALRIEIKFPFHSTFHEDIPVTVATVPVLHYDFNENNE